MHSVKIDSQSNRGIVLQQHDADHTQCVGMPPAGTRCSVARRRRVSARHVGHGQHATWTGRSTSSVTSVDGLHAWLGWYPHGQQRPRGVGCYIIESGCHGDVLGRAVMRTTCDDSLQHNVAVRVHACDSVLLHDVANRYGRCADTTAVTIWAYRLVCALFVIHVKDRFVGLWDVMSHESLAQA